ncbi:spinster family MFS transporter [Urbifossiella limnaea]|uniref:Hexuronate transporter n=1 Tax=Urbifossiella limnaea TaxID=2528023 RepID=A0A517XUK0_9BACT|nr:MFS transporter [Urbifossiella limnaea]QDU21174.1 Hexuronate transporter [Urbifossiella limnaea]
MPGVPTGGTGPREPVPGARAALLLLLAINLFNYIDRQVLSAVLPMLQLDAALFDPTDPDLNFKLGILTSVFLVTYTMFSPVFGWFGDRGSRWPLVGIAVIVWSLASGGSGLAGAYGIMVLTRCLVGVGEAAYGPVAPSMLSDMYPVADRGKVMSWFYLAIPVGSALGFVVGGLVAGAFGWRMAFQVVVIPGLILGGLCFLMRDPRVHLAPAADAPKARSPGYLAVLRELTGVKSFVLCCAGMTCTTFMLGGVAAWAPTYIFQREARFALTPAAVTKLEELKASDESRVVPDEVTTRLRSVAGEKEYDFPAFKALLLELLGPDRLRQYGERVYEAAPTADSATVGGVSTRFGAIVVLSGLGATLLGGWLGDNLRAKGVRGAYFQVAGWGTVLSFPLFVAMLYVPFPWAWLPLFVAVFGLFVNTGPANTILANVTRADIRGTAFAINIFVIHILGDVISPPLIGLAADAWGLTTAFLATSVMILAGGILWVVGARYLDADTARAASS